MQHGRLAALPLVPVPAQPRQLQQPALRQLKLEPALRLLKLEPALRVRQLEPAPHPQRQLQALWEPQVVCHRTRSSVAPLWALFPAVVQDRTTPRTPR